MMPSHFHTMCPYPSLAINVPSVLQSIVPLSVLWCLAVFSTVLLTSCAFPGTKRLLTVRMAPWVTGSIYRASARLLNIKQLLVCQTYLPGKSKSNFLQIYWNSPDIPSLKSCQNCCNKAKYSHQYKSFTFLLSVLINHPWILILCSHSSSLSYSQCCWQVKVYQRQMWSTVYLGHWSMIHGGGAYEISLTDTGHVKKLEISVPAQRAIIQLPWLQARKSYFNKQIEHLGVAAKPCGKASCQKTMHYSETPLEENLIPVSARMKIPWKSWQWHPYKRWGLGDILIVMQAGLHWHELPI